MRLQTEEQFTKQNSNNKLKDSNYYTNNVNTSNISICSNNLNKSNITYNYQSLLSVINEYEDNIKYILDQYLDNKDIEFKLILKDKDYLNYAFISYINKLKQNSFNFGMSENNMYNYNNQNLQPIPIENIYNFSNIINAFNVLKDNSLIENIIDFDDNYNNISYKINNFGKLITIKESIKFNNKLRDFNVFISIHNSYIKYYTIFYFDKEYLPNKELYFQDIISDFLYDYNIIEYDINDIFINSNNECSINSNLNKEEFYNLINNMLTSNLNNTDIHNKKRIVLVKNVSDSALIEDQEDNNYNFDEKLVEEDLNISNINKKSVISYGKSNDIKLYLDNRRNSSYNNIINNNYSYKENTDKPHDINNDIFNNVLYYQISDTYVIYDRLDIIKTEHSLNKISMQYNEIKNLDNLDGLIKNLNIEYLYKLLVIDSRCLKSDYKYDNNCTTNTSNYNKNTEDLKNKRFRLDLEELYIEKSNSSYIWMSKHIIIFYYNIL